MLGSFNARIATAARIEETGQSFIYDSTTLDLVRKAQNLGAGVGDHIHSDLGCYVLKSAPHDDRAGGLWATRVWP